jgi:small subunit ribosomal protein S20
MMKRLATLYLYLYDCAFSINALAFLGIKSMANSAQARKRARQAVKQRAHNASLRSTLRTAVKRVQKAIVAGDKAAAQSIYTESVSVIDRIADKKIVHKNKASRHKSRLSAQIKALAA